MEIIFVFSAFFAGLISFFAPCTLPLIPAFLSFISGISQKELRDPLLKISALRRIFLNGLAFIFGFIFVFVFLGILTGFVGSAVADTFFNYKSVMVKIGGAIIVFFGLFLLGFFSIFKTLSFLFRDYKVIPKFIVPGNPFSSFLVGGIFSFGWTPCVGHVLGSVIILAGTAGRAFEGGFLLFIFSLGLALPFFFLTLAFSKAEYLINKMSKYSWIVSVIGGIFLIFTGLLLLTNNFGLTIQYGYKWFDFLNYDSLLNYL